MIPKDSKCAQKLSGKETKTVLNIPTEIDSSTDEEEEEEEEKIDNTENGSKFYENISTYSTKNDITISSKMSCNSPPLNKNDVSKSRSMSDGTLRNNNKRVSEGTSSTLIMTMPKISLNKLQHSKSESCRCIPQQIEDMKDKSRSMSDGILKKNKSASKDCSAVTMMRPKNAADSSSKSYRCDPVPVEADTINKPRSMSDGTLKKNKFLSNNTTCALMMMQKDNHPVTTAKISTDASRQSKTKTDLLKTILNMLPGEFTNRRQNSVHPITAPNTSSEDSGISVDNSSSATAHLQQQVPECLPSEDNESEEEDSSDSTRRLDSSVLSLRGLFGGSSQSSTTTNKEDIPRLSPKDGLAAITRPQSLTSNSSSSTGYDNLGFVPVEILSRRSSIFSDASC